MSRLLLEDTFVGNAKIRALSDREFRVWLRLLSHCARANDGRVDVELVGEVAGLTAAIFARYIDLGLLDHHDDVFEVHDWGVYNGATIDERVAAFLHSHPGASANEVVRGVPARRSTVLDAIKRYQQNGSE